MNRPDTKNAKKRKREKKKKQKAENNGNAAIWNLSLFILLFFPWRTWRLGGSFWYCLYL
jgi:hypothetical protein